MSTKTLVVDEQRESVLDALRKTLTLVGPDLGVSEVDEGYAGDAGEVYRNVDQLIAIARRTTADFVEPYMAQIQEEICTGCPHQFASGHCPLRQYRMCTLDRTVMPVFEAIAGALEHAGDPEYCQTHGVGNPGPLVQLTRGTTGRGRAAVAFLDTGAGI